MNYITFISIFIAVLALVIQPLQGNPLLFCGTIISLVIMFIVKLACMINFANPESKIKSAMN